MDEDRYTSSYRFGPLERRGLVGSWRIGQVLVVGFACLVAVLVFRAAPSSAGFVVGLLLIATGAFITLAPLAGRSLEQWAPLLSDWLLVKVRGAHRYRSLDPFSGNGAPLSLPASISECRVLSFPLADGHELGVVRDRASRAYTAVLGVQMRALGLLAAADQERRLAAWGRTLASLAGDRSVIRRIQLLERTVPCDPDELIRHAHDHGSDRHGAAWESYIELLDSAAQVAQDHELLIAIQIDERRAWRIAGSDSHARSLDPQGQACAILARELQGFAQRLDSDELHVLGLLDPEQLTAAIRLGFDPYRRRSAAALSPGPTAADAAWSSYRADSALHRTYWVAEWPRTQVGPAFFTPLLLGLQAVRAVSIVFDPVPPGRARAAVEAAITSDEADEQVRAERGFRLTARRRRQADSARNREQELADGHEEMRFAGFVTVSGRDEDELAAASAELEHAAQRAFLVLEPLWGQQDLGLAFASLPLARGLKSAKPWSVSA